MRVNEAIIIDWRYSLADEKTPFSMVEVRLLKQRGERIDKSTRTPRFAMHHTDLSILEHQLADMGYVPVLRGDDGLTVKSKDTSPWWGCFILLVAAVVAAGGVLWVQKLLSK